MLVLYVNTLLLTCSQVTFPPPYGGYDHNWALFGLTLRDAANRTRDGTISQE